jgi:hypothetical protein
VVDGVALGVAVGVIDGVVLGVAVGVGVGPATAAVVNTKNDPRANARIDVTRI